MRIGLLALVAGAGFTMCSTSSSKTQQPDADSDGAGAQTADEPVVLTPEGPPMEATVPLWGGSSVDLAELRGRIVMLELSTSDRPHWAESQQQYRRLVDVLGDDRLLPWDRDKPPFVLGWDPQGALALRLGVMRMPTAFVLDRDGRRLAQIDAELGGEPEAYRRQVERVLKAAVDR